MIRALSTALALCLLPIAASAQTGGAAAADLTPSRASQSPMIVERVHNGFLVAPDFKITEVDEKSSALAGGYAGTCCLLETPHGPDLLKADRLKGGGIKPGRGH